MSGNGNGKFSIAEMRKTTPAPDPVEACRKQLALAMYDAVSEKDVANMVGILRKKAEGGDLHAMKMFFELVASQSKQTKSDTESQAVKQLAAAMQDLVDEIRVAKDMRKRREPLRLEDDGDDD